MLGLNGSFTTNIYMDWLGQGYANATIAHALSGSDTVTHESRVRIQYIPFLNKSSMTEG
jgi:hypothetical protein